MQGLQAMLKKIAEKKHYLFMAVAVVLLGCFIYKRFIYKAPVPAPLPARVQVAKAEYRERLNNAVTSTTSLKAVQDVAIKAKVEAPVQRLYVQRNQWVKQGELLVELEHNSESAQVVAARAQVNMNQAAAAAAKWRAENAQTEQARYDKLIADGVVSRSEVDSKRTTYGTAAADYEQAVAAIGYARGALAAAEASLGDHLIKAPFDGVILDDYDLHIGDKVKTDANLLRIADISTMKCSISLQEDLLGRVQPGMEAQVVLTAFPEESFTGKLATINTFVDPATHTFLVDVMLDNKALEYKLQPGMFAKVNILEQQEKLQLLTVPKEAVNKGTVLVVQGNKVEQRQVQTGTSDSQNIVITSGLKQGELVVVSGGKTLKNGEAVSYSLE